MNETLQEYFDALERLKSNHPINVPKGSKINNDTVALEAEEKGVQLKKVEKFLQSLSNL